MNIDSSHALEKNNNEKWLIIVDIFGYKIEMNSFVMGFPFTFLLSFESYLLFLSYRKLFKIIRKNHKIIFHNQE